MSTVLTAEKLAQLTAEHGRIEHVVVANNRDVVVRAPQRGEYGRFRSEGMAQKKAEAQEVLVRAIVVFPSREEFGLLLDEYPAVADCPAMTAAVERLTGLTLTAAEGK